MIRGNSGNCPSVFISPYEEVDCTQKFSSEKDRGGFSMWFHQLPPVKAVMGDFFSPCTFNMDDSWRKGYPF